jgi:predicted RNA binding protein YcfA (HicA-like mRNA interferase family)
MPRIIPVDWKTLVQVFELYGCKYKRKKGSHHILICPGAKRAVVIPEYNEVDVEIIRNNMKTADMTREVYFDLLEKL